MKKLYVNEEIVPAIFELIKDSNEYLVIVSPYIQIWGHLENRLRETRAKIEVFIRDENLNEKKDHIKILMDIGAKVYAVPNLHAKIYINENYCILSSMNMYAHSAINNEEIAIVIEDRKTLKEIDKYIDISLDRKAREIRTGDFTNKKDIKPTSIINKQNIRAKSNGNCIRCATKIPYNPERPYCKKCYDSWKEYENYSYKKKYCHKCKKKITTTIDKPLCKTCYN
jgi:phosphatidylserine/phosphatidylglycerophosphate/cardiolipin synthase-like enzyme